VYAWPSRLGAWVIELKPELENIRGVAISPTGNEIAVAAGNEAVVWQRNHPDAPAIRLAHPCAVLAIGFEATGTEIVTLCDKNLRRWTSPSVFHDADIGSNSGVLAISGGSHCAAIAEGKAVVIRDLVQGREVQRIEHGARVVNIAIARDGTLATADETGLVRVWRRRPGNKAEELVRLQVLRQRAASIPLALSSDARLLATSGPRIYLVAPRDIVAQACSQLGPFAKSFPDYAIACQ
jgi:hypothetical protein